MTTATTNVEVWEQSFNGNNWETIPGAAWPMEMREGESFREACIRHGGEFSQTEQTRLVVFGDDRDEMYAETFEPGELG